MYTIKKEGPFHEGNTEEEDNSYVVFKWNIPRIRGRIQRKTWCMGPYARIDSITFTMGNPMPESTLTPSQGLRIWLSPLGFGSAHLFLEQLLDICLKGQCHEIFDFWFFSRISFPQAPEYTIRAVSNFFENSRRYSQLKVCHRCQRHRWQMQKIFNHKSFHYLVWTPVGSIVNL
jgi:hypothetical protein